MSKIIKYIINPDCIALGHTMGPSEVSRGGYFTEGEVI